MNKDKEPIICDRCGESISLNVVQVYNPRTKKIENYHVSCEKEVKNDIPPRPRMF